MAKRKGGPNKMELVREALASGVEDAAGIVEFVTQRGGSMSAQMASNYKSAIKKKGKSGTRGKPGRKPAASAGVKPATAPANGDIMATLKAAKSLIEATGSASAAKEILDLIG
ncbi:hypothetical protein BH10PLA2_BH10PLA2_21020 [soil metagenome]